MVFVAGLLVASTITPAEAKKWSHVAVVLSKGTSEPHTSPRKGSTDSPNHDFDKQHRVVAEAWLGWQCKMVAGVLQGAVFSVKDRQLKTLLAHWPATNKQASNMGGITNQSFDSGGVIIHTVERSGESDNLAQDHIAIPISNDGGDFVVVLYILSHTKSQQQAVVQLVQWGGIWLGSLDTVFAEFNRSVSTVSFELAEQVLSHDNLYAAGLEAAN